ncbi:MAG: DUF3382 domain-containing protein, partial [Burkholderiales bacterium]
MDAAAEPRPLAPRLFASLKDALGTALLALALAVPILALRTEQNISNELILQPRWGYVGIAVLLAFVARLLYLLTPALPRLRKAPRASGPSVTGRAISVTGLIGLVAYPLLALALVGQGGAIKWIDNFGIQILIYVMLGWGLNIVVGLAGLLDLGYVAFYAVGAYSYALLAKSFGFSFWVLLPLAGIL